MRKNVLFLFILLFASSCVHKNNPVLLRVGDHAIRQDELKKSFNRFSLNYEKKIDKSTFEGWLNGFIQGVLIEEKAKSMGYDVNNGKIHSRQSTFMKFIIAQYDGKYYKETITSTVSASGDELDEALEKIRYEYTFEVLKFSDKEQLSNILGTDTLLKDKTDFTRIVEKSRKRGKNSTTLQYRWPFWQLMGLQDTLYKMEQGMVSPSAIQVFQTPYKDAFCFLYLKSKEPIAEIMNNPPPKERLRQVVLQYKEQIMFHKKLREIYDTSEFTITQNLVDSLYWQIISSNKSYDIDTNCIPGLLNKNIMIYKLYNEPVKVSVRDFASFYNNLPIRSRVKNINDLEEYVQDMVIFDYLWEEAEQSGYTQRESFVNLERHHLRKNIIKIYLENEVYSGITVNEEEIKKAYTEKTSLFTDGEFTVFNLCIFENPIKGEKCLNKLQDVNPDEAFLMLKDTSQIKGIISYKELQEIRYDDTTYTDDIVQQLFSLERGQITELIRLKEGQPAIMIKIGEKGTYVKQFDEVKDWLKSSLLYKKKKEAEDRLIADLKKENKIVNKVDYKKFINEKIATSISPVAEKE